MTLGYGCWQLGGACTFGHRQTGWGNTDMQKAKEAIELAWANGVRFFDTAPGYGKGRSETFLGGSLPDEALICTKYGSYEDSSGNSYLDFSSTSLQTSLYDSLNRLNRNSVDTLLLHSPPDDFVFEYDLTSAFESLKSQGLIKHYGASVRTYRGACNVLNQSFGDTIEGVFNLLDRRVESEVFTHPNFGNYRFIARVPLASGFLSNGFLENKNLSFPENDIRFHMHPEDRGWFENSVDKLCFLKDLPGGISTSALRYVLFNPHVRYVIPGMRTPSQVENNLLAVQLGPLETDVVHRIREILPFTNPRWM
ncbi:MAG: aldo/keto reductase [Leadbetterella sp.]